MQIISATVAANANVDLRRFAESLSRRNPAIRIVKANRKSLRIEYGPLLASESEDIREIELEEYLADIRAWFGACLIQIGLASSNSSPFVAAPRIRKHEASLLDDADARAMLESIAAAPNAGARRGWAWNQMRHCPEPYALPIAA